MTTGTVGRQTHKTGSGEKNADFYGKVVFFFPHFIFAYCLQKVKPDITRYWANRLFNHHYRSGYIKLANQGI